MPLALVEGSAENTTLVTELIVGLHERGLDVTRPIFACLDGGKALHRAVADVFVRGDPRKDTTSLLGHRSETNSRPPGRGRVRGR